MREDDYFSAASIPQVDETIRATPWRSVIHPFSGAQVAGRMPRPPTAGPSDCSLVASTRSGDQDAATQLYMRYSKRLTGLVKNRCSAALARCAGVEDIVQSVFGTFFRRIGEGSYEIPDGDVAWKVLSVIAMNKVRSEATFYYAAKRDAHRTIGGSTAQHFIESRAGIGGPVPERFEQILQEILERLPARSRRLVRLRLDGFTVAESAHAARCSMRTAERVIHETRLIYSKLLRADY